MPNEGNARPSRLLVAGVTASRWHQFLATVARPASRRGSLWGAQMARAAKRIGVTLAAASAIVLISCSADGPGTTLTLNDGSEVTPLLREESCSVVLVMSPEECLSCTGILEAWVGLGQASQFEVHLLLTGEPSAKQAEKLTLQRVPLRGITSEEHGDSETKAYLFDGRELIDSIVGVPQQSVLLSQLSDAKSRDHSGIDRGCWWHTIETRATSR